MVRRLQRLYRVALWLLVAAPGVARGAEPVADAPPIIAPLQVGAFWPVNHPTHHVQGLCVSDDWFWISSVDKASKSGWIFRVERGTGRVATERQVHMGDQFHPGGMQLRHGKLWLPLAEYRPRSTSTVLTLDATTLDTLGQFAVDDHLGAVAVADDGRVLAANWDARQVYVFAPDGMLQRCVPSRTGVAYQDWEWHDGKLYATGQTSHAGVKSAVVDVLDPETLELVKRYLLQGQVRSGGTNFGREGLSVHRGKFYVLPEDGPRTTVYEFSPD